MILYFSGTGNSEYAARRIGLLTGDSTVSLFERIRSRDFSPMESQRPWVIAVPTYAWRIPRIVQEWLENTPLTGSRDLYFVLTCGSSTGNAGRYLEALSAAKEMRFCGQLGVVMPENYIALFATPEKEQALAILEKAEAPLRTAAELILKGQPFPRPAVTLGGRLCSSPVNRAFYPLFVHAKKFKAADSCLSCGKCEQVCPLHNIRLQNGKPLWGNRCTHCMACISRCPAGAISYGRHSQKYTPYLCPKDAAE